MRKPVQIIGTTLAAAALVAGSSAAASADGFGHHGFGGADFGRHSSFDPARSFGAGPARAFGAGPGRTFGADPARTAHKWGAEAVRAFGSAPARRLGSDAVRTARRLRTDAVRRFGDRAGTPTRARFDRPFHLTFAQRKAAIVAGLTAADNRLGDLETTLTSAESNDPTGTVAQLLGVVTQARTRVEGLLTQVQGASNEQQLDAVLASIAPQIHPPVPGGVPGVPGM